MSALWKKAGLTTASAILSGASGAEPATGGERTFLEGHRGIPVRATGTTFGHTVEAAFVLNIALAALCLRRGALFPPNDPSGMEIDTSGSPTKIVVTGVGHWRGEGLACVDAAS